MLSTSLVIRQIFEIASRASGLNQQTARPLRSSVGLGRFALNQSKSSFNQSSCHLLNRSSSIRRLVARKMPAAVPSDRRSASDGIVKRMYMTAGLLHLKRLVEAVGARPA